MTLDRERNPIKTECAGWTTHHAGVQLELVGDYLIVLIPELPGEGPARRTTVLFTQFMKALLEMGIQQRMPPALSEKLRKLPDPPKAARYSGEELRQATSGPNPDWLAYTVMAAFNAGVDSVGKV